MEAGDLTVLLELNNNNTNRPALRSKLWSAGWQSYVAQRRINELAKQQAAVELKRSEALFESKLVSKAELDTHQFQWAKSQAAIENFDENARAQWRTEITRTERNLRDLESEARQLGEETELGRIRSPTAGTILLNPGLAVGAFVSGGAHLGMISPEGGLIAEAFISPKDVVHIRAGQAARVMVDGFAYTEWGMLSGSVSEIGSDFIAINSFPAFKVTIKLNETQLRLANGATGDVRKGMTCQVRFPVNRRSFLQLLYETASQWFNPSHVEKKEMTP